MTSVVLIWTVYLGIILDVNEESLIMFLSSKVNHHSWNVQRMSDWFKKNVKFVVFFSE